MPYVGKFESIRSSDKALYKALIISVVRGVVFWFQEKIPDAIVCTRFFLTFAVLKTGRFDVLFFENDADVAQLARAADL